MYTKHIGNEQKLIGVAVNYDNCSSTIKLQITNDWQIGKTGMGREILNENL